MTQIKSVRVEFAKSVNPGTGVRSHFSEKTIAREETLRELNSSSSFQSDTEYIGNPVIIKRFKLHEYREEALKGFANLCELWAVWTHH